MHPFIHINHFLPSFQKTGSSSHCIALAVKHWRYFYAGTKISKIDHQFSLLEKNKDHTQHKKSQLAVTKEKSIFKKSQNSHSIPSKNNPKY
jgi:hypothetical protein